MKLVFCLTAVLLSSILTGCTKSKTESYEDELRSAGCKIDYLVGSYTSYDCSMVDGYPDNVTIWN
jgi:hypothetical protein